MLITDNYLSSIVRGTISNHGDIGHSSLDVHIKGHAWVEEEAPNPVPFHPEDDGSFPKKKVLFFDGKYFKLGAGRFALLETQEKFHMPNDVVGLFTLRSVYAKAGLDQASSQILQPGWEGNLILEVRNNLKRSAMKLYEGDPIGQIHFFSCDPYEIKP